MSIRQITINQLSELTGIDRRTIKKRLEDAQLVAKAGPGRGHYYDAREALPVLFASSSASSDNIEKKLLEEQLRIDSARAEKLELEVAKLRGLVVPIEDVARTVEKEYSYVRSQLRAIPSKLAKPLSMVTDPHEVHRMVDELVTECLTELIADTNYEQQRLNLESPGAEAPHGSAEDLEAATETQSSGVGGHVSLPESGE